jgi:uncharacterized membrane protein YciS (DUF1049 family)
MTSTLMLSVFAAGLVIGAVVSALIARQLRTMTRAVGR